MAHWMMVGVVAVALSGASASLLAQQGPPELPDEVSEWMEQDQFFRWMGLIQQGDSLFNNGTCTRCHGEDVRGNGPDMLSDHPTKDFHAFGKRFAVTLHGGAPRSWFRKIVEGHGPEVEYPAGRSRVMPAFGDTLSREQIWLVRRELHLCNVASYVLRLLSTLEFY